MKGLSNMKWCLLGYLIIVFILMVASVLMPYRLTDAIKWVADNDIAGKLRVLPEQAVHEEETLTEMVVESVGISKVNYQAVVILKEKGGEVSLPIWIGLLEANAVSVMLEGVEVPRPLTPDLLCSIVDRMGASVDYVVINDIQDQTFYADVYLQADWRQMEIDARPSDAIAIALRVKAPIYVTKLVLDKAGILLDHEADSDFTI